jgi:hypothetical protein
MITHDDCSVFWNRTPGIVDIDDLEWVPMPPGFKVPEWSDNFPHSTEAMMSNQQIDRRAYLRVVSKLANIVDEMETIGAQDMGHLPLRLARRFHTASHEV